MRQPSKTSLYFLFTFLVLSLCAFRTPVRMYAGAFSVKLQLKKDFTEYDIPVWIKPDQAESSVDPILLHELGYVEKIFAFDDVKASGYSLPLKKFKSMKSEWAFVPDFAKSCCHGVIGRDILEQFEIRFQPGSPAHLEWSLLPVRSEKIVYSPAFLASMKSLFSLQKEISVPFVLNLREGKLQYEEKPGPVLPGLFSFFFVPPERLIKVTSILSKDATAAKKAGFTPGLVIAKINGEDVAALDRWVIEKYLRGEKSSTITLVTKNKKEFTFDFSERQFK